MKIIVFVFIVLISFSCQSQTTYVNKPVIDNYDSTNVLRIEWQKIVPGIDFCETYAPRKSEINDSKIQLFRIDPVRVEFELMMASELKTKALTVTEWADSFNFNIVFNAGMYDLRHKKTSRGFLKNKSHTNQASVLPNFKSAIVFQPKDTLLPKFQVVDLECEAFESIRKSYTCIAQGLRMLDCNGAPIGWNKRKQYCSQLICTMDDSGLMYLIFVRSPYLHNEMIAYMQEMNLNLVNAIYLEGGPQTSLYVDICTDKENAFHCEKVGSYVSETYAHDKNLEFWPLPNIIGIRVKQ